MRRAEKIQVKQLDADLVELERDATVAGSAPDKTTAGEQTDS